MVYWLNVFATTKTVQYCNQQYWIEILVWGIVTIYSLLFLQEPQFAHQKGTPITKVTMEYEGRAEMGHLKSQHLHRRKHLEVKIVSL